MCPRAGRRWKLERTLASVGPYFTVNLAQGKLIFTLPAGIRTDGGENLLLRRDGPEKVLDAHDHDLRFASAINDKAGLRQAGAPHDLA
jgi:hypothetical protein